MGSISWRPFLPRIPARRLTSPPAPILTATRYSTDGRASRSSSTSRRVLLHARCALPEPESDAGRDDSAPQLRPEPRQCQPQLPRSRRRSVLADRGRALASNNNRDFRMAVAAAGRRWRRPRWRSGRRSRRRIRRWPGRRSRRILPRARRRIYRSALQPDHFGPSAQPAQSRQSRAHQRHHHVASVR